MIKLEYQLKKWLPLADNWVSKIKLSKDFIRNTVKRALNEDLYPSGDISSNLVRNNKVIKASDFAGSTSGMIKYVQDNQPKKVMMVTECSMSDNIQVENPNVEFIRPCNLCPHMKRITLPKILDCLENESGEIIMDQETINKARLSVEKMVAIGR